jgi:prophage DNA circulation protein
MISLFNTLFSASFKGVPFLIDGSDMSAGRKTVIHEYPNKDFRSVEDLGKNLRTYNIRGVLSASDGITYRILKNALQNAFDTKNSGTFIHPVDGAVNVSCTNYTFTEDFSKTGELNFTASLLENFENIFPTSTKGSSSYIIGLIATLGPVLINFLSTQFTMRFKKNVPDAATKLINLNIGLNNFSTPVNTADNSLSVFKNNSANVTANSVSLVQDSPSLANSISDLLYSFNNLAVNPYDGYLMNATNFGFGRNDSFINQNTGQSIERYNDRLSLNCTVNALLLMNMYSNAALIIYLDNLQLDKISKDLENKYQYLLANNNLDSDTLDQLETLRNEMRKFFNTVSVNISKVIEITINPTPLTILLYTYYEDFDNENEILSLNKIYDPTRIYGNIKIVTV